MKSEKILTYTAVFEPAAEGGYIVSVPALPGCLTQGETFEVTKKNIQEAISMYLSVLKEDGDEIPEESREYVVANVTATLPV